MSFSKRTWEKRSRYWDRLNNIEDELANGSGGGGTGGGGAFVCTESEYDSTHMKLSATAAEINAALENGQIIMRKVSANGADGYNYDYLYESVIYEGSYYVSFGVQGVSAFSYEASSADGVLLRRTNI